MPRVKKQSLQVSRSYVTWYIKQTLTWLGIYVSNVEKLRDSSQTHCSKMWGNDKGRIVKGVLWDDRDRAEQEMTGFIQDPLHAIERLHNMDLYEVVMEQFRKSFVENDDVSHLSLCLALLNEHNNARTNL